MHDLRRCVDASADEEDPDREDVPTADWILYEHVMRTLKSFGGNITLTASCLGRSRNWGKRILRRGAPPR